MDSLNTFLTQPGGPNERWQARVRAVFIGGLAAVASATAAFAPPASAEDNRRISVAYRDLDLTSADGMKILRRRLVSAAQTVCDHPLYGSAPCVAQALRRARPQMAQAAARVREAAEAR